MADDSLQIQSDVLTDDTSLNTLMPSDTLDFLNKALRTDQTNIIGAVNDLQSLINLLVGNFTDFGNKFNGLLMDVDNTDGQAKLTEMGTLLGYSTVLEAIVELAKRVNGSSGSGASGLIKGFAMDDVTNILTLTLSNDTTYPIDFTPMLNTKVNTTDLEWGEF